MGNRTPRIGHILRAEQHRGSTQVWQEVQSSTQLGRRVPESVLFEDSSTNE